MNITISLFWVILLIFITHTILTHLINWMWRSISTNDDDIIIKGGLILTILELLTIIIILYKTT